MNYEQYSMSIFSMKYEQSEVFGLEERIWNVYGKKRSYKIVIEESGDQNLLQMSSFNIGPPRQIVQTCF